MFDSLIPLQKTYLLQSVEYDEGVFSFAVKPNTSKCMIVVCYLSSIDHNMYRYPDNYLCINDPSEFFPQWCNMVLHSVE